MALKRYPLLKSQLLRLLGTEKIGLSNIWCIFINFLEAN